MKEHGRTFQCEPCRQTIIFVAVSDAKPYTAAAPRYPPIAPGTMPRINRPNAQKARGADRREIW
jgi:hypothetical protein